MFFRLFFVLAAKSRSGTNPVEVVKAVGATRSAPQPCHLP